jgi:hypothetical protein
MRKGLDILLYFYRRDKMRYCLNILLLTILLIGCQFRKSDIKISPSQTESINKDKVPSGNWVSLKKYIGTFPKNTDFFKNPIIVNELKRILGADYKSYCDHVTLSGCGAMMSQDNLIYGDVSQLHVGGYGSEIFIDLQKRKIYLFWLPGMVRDKKYKIYGDKPIPQNILKLFVDNMNEGWGHVVNFSIESDSIKIDLK